MTNKERMLQMVLDDIKLQELYEYDKSEYDIARENFETKEIEYPDEENLDDIPEELVEIVENSEEEIILEDQSDGEQLIFDDEEIDN